MALAPSLAVDSFHTLRRKAKAPWEQAPKGLQITEPDRSPKLRDNALFHHRPRRKPPHSPSVFLRSLNYVQVPRAIESSVMSLVMSLNYVEITSAAASASLARRIFSRILRPDACQTYFF